MSKNVIEKIEKLKAKSGPRIGITFKVLPEVDERIRRLSDETGLSMSLVIDVATQELEKQIKKAKGKTAR